ncbi:MAG: reverse transcriptase family protein [Sedimenticola sp.]
MEWILSGRPRDRDNPQYIAYKAAKREFKHAQAHAIEMIQTNFYSDLDASSNCDMRLFWSLVNTKRKKKRNAITHLLTDNGTSTNPDEIADIFRNYFSNVFEPNNSNAYDNMFKETVEQKVTEFLRSDDHEVNDTLCCEVGSDQLYAIIRTLSKRKAPGDDQIVNEHIQCGGSVLMSYLAKLYNMMITQEYVPKGMKTGIIIPIYKLGKQRHVPESYRPITLLSVIYKIFEKIIYDRLQQWCQCNDKRFPCPQQNAYQKLLGATTVSFNLQETVAHNRELSSDTFAAFLDTSKAFDNVWHYGLFTKLWDFGIRGRILRLLIECYTGLESRVSVNGVTSSVFPVKQGVRQGGVMSTWLYLLYVEDLSEYLQSSQLGSQVGNIRCGNPTLADDIALLCPNISGIEAMLKIAYDYSIKWRFSYNPDKCKLVHFTRNMHSNTRPVKFGDGFITCHDSATHVGIQLNKSLKCNDAITQRCDKGRSSIFSILSIDSISGNVNPITLSSIMSKVCIPVTLYGCELWHNMTSADTYKIEKIIRLAAKSCQNLHIRTRTDMALSMIGWLPAAALIAKRKLHFLQRLCTMPTELLCKQIFTFRLHLYFVKGCTGQLGFIPDICKLLIKYRLMDFLTGFLQHATFPTKQQWKNMVHANVSAYHNSIWLEHIGSDHEFELFRHLHTTTLHPASVWKMIDSKENLQSALVVAKVWTAVPNNMQIKCSKCDTLCNDIYMHLICRCQFYDQLRSSTFAGLHRILSTDAYSDLLDRHVEVCMYGLLGSKTFLDRLDADLCKSYLQATFTFVRKVITLYHRQ